MDKEESLILILKAILDNQLEVAKINQKTTNNVVKISRYFCITTIACILGFLISQFEFTTEEQEIVTIHQDTEGGGSNNMEHINLGDIDYGKTNDHNSKD